ncbi:hypothetical protein [Halotalea alkalilenta]|uniref:hypothetical protein n=1 Tax=Halotalea alkalilenta TaxID=376489 RepID=UPI0012370BB8|nr:hypothetical protein [Halotalea alkalilenta]
MITALRGSSFSHCGFKYPYFLIFGALSSILTAAKSNLKLSYNLEAMATALGALLSTDGRPVPIPIRSDSGYHRSPRRHSLR